MQKKTTILSILGATATGKTELALQLSAHYPVEIISVDAVQIYKHLNIGSAKPENAILKKHPHHLIDIIEPEESYSAAKFCQDSQNLIKKIQAKGKIPLLVGGSMMYYHALFNGLSDLPASTKESRAYIEARYQEDQGKTLYQELKNKDPETANKISANDRQRLIRFMELLYLTQTPPSALFAQQKKSPLQSLNIAINIERANLHKNIATRFQNMIKQGLIEEVAELKKRPQLSAAHPSMRSVGYRQIWHYLDGHSNKEHAIEQGIIATRQLAKRQITWLNNGLKANIAEIIYEENPEKRLKAVLALCAQHLTH